MITRRRGTVVDIVSERRDVLEIVVDIDGERARAIAYPSLVGVIEPGARVLLNTTAVELGLGTGGVHFVIAVESSTAGDVPTSRAMKLRYTPLQTAVDVVEETHRAAIDASASLDSMPVVVAGLHSAVAPAIIGARTVAPALRVAYVMTDGAALHMGFSETVPALRASGLVQATFTAGQAIGGDHEAVTLHGALIAARAVAAADLAVVSMGPGNIGTGSRWGFALLGSAAVIDAVDALGGSPFVVARLSFADARERHRGLSHHTTTMLQVARARATVALPRLERARLDVIHSQLGALPEKHYVVEVDLGAAEQALRDSPVP
ncbi:MAG: DUF3866 family protein, partial [Actinomycetota bacterium]